MPQERFVVSIAGPDQLAVGSERAYALLESVLKRGIEQHLEGGQAWFRSADLSVRVNDCRFEGTYARVEVSVDGQVNDVLVARQQFDAEITAPVGTDTMALATGGAAGLAVQQAVEAAMERLQSEQPTPHPNALDQKILFQVLEFLDESVGRTASPSGQRWDRIRRMRWIVAAAACVVVLVLGLVRGGLSDGIVAGAMFGVLAAVLTFLIVHCVGLYAMPDTFFTTETAGKKALLMAGVGSVGALRVVVVIATVFLGACLVGDLILVWGSANWQ